MTERFFAPAPLDRGRIEISGPEFEHMTRVMRLGPGDAALLVDGYGAEGDAVVAEVGRSSALLDVSAVRRFPRPPGMALAAAMPKGKRARWLVEKCTELGASAVVFVEFERSSVRNPGRGKIASLRASAAEALKQSGRLHMPDISGPVPLGEFLAGSLPDRRIVLDPKARESLSEVLLLRRDPAAAVAVAGPEGGLSQAETSALESAGFAKARLSAAVLRIETACLAALAVFESVSASSRERAAGPPRAAGLGDAR